MKPIVLSVVIPVFNKFDLTRSCLEFLKTFAPEITMEVIVVDNGSSDATATQLEPLGRGLFQEFFQRVRFEENRNFGPACNAGALAAHGDLVFFLNNDTELTSGWLPPLLDGLDDACGAVGPLLMYPEKESFLCDRVQHVGVCCEPQIQFCHLYEFFPVSHPLIRKARALQFVTGAALLMRKEVFMEVGMFHEGYMNGGEDLDLCVQLRRKGYSLSVAHESRIYHLQSQTSGRHDHEAHNGALFRERCSESFFPDLHLQLKADGYELALNEFLNPYARLPQRRIALMEKAFFKEQPDVESCVSMLLREPLFYPAYERLADFYEESNSLDLLTKLRFLQAKLFPSLKTWTCLREAADRSGNWEMKQEGEGLIAASRLLTKDGNLVEVAKGMMQLCERIRQPSVAIVYSDWLESYAGQ